MPGQSLNMHIVPLPKATLHHFSDTGKAGTPAHIAAYRTGTMLAIAQAWLGVIKHLATHSGNHDICPPVMGYQHGVPRCFSQQLASSLIKYHGIATTDTLHQRI